MTEKLKHTPKPGFVHAPNLFGRVFRFLSVAGYLADCWALAEEARALLAGAVAAANAPNAFLAVALTVLAGVFILGVVNALIGAWNVVTAPRAPTPAPVCRCSGERQRPKPARKLRRKNSKIGKKKR